MPKPVTAHYIAQDLQTWNQWVEAQADNVLTWAPYWDKAERGQTKPHKTEPLSPLPRSTHC